MKNFLLITNSAKDINAEYSKKVIETLERHGCRCCAHFQTSEKNGGGFALADPVDVPAETEAVLSLGGDGTFIHVSKDLLKLDIPVLGINLGTLGYLTEVGTDQLESAVEALASDNYHIEEHILLKGTILRDGKPFRSDLALNDIVMNRSIMTGISYFDLKIDGKFLNGYAADGIIVSTPTGSTGYNLSAGGPIVLPTASIVLITPLCAHTLNSRSIVLPANVRIEIIPRVRDDRKQLNYVSFDGEQEIRLEDGDEISIRMADVGTKIIKINDTSFVENLSKKMR